MLPMIRIPPGRFATGPISLPRAFATLAFAGLLAASGAGAATTRHLPASAGAVRIEGLRQLMGTACSITAEGPDSARTGAAIEKAFDEIERIDEALSATRDDGELKRLNASAFENRVPCSPDLYAVLDSALALANETEGAFDPTVGAYEIAWDLRGDGRVPEPESLGVARQCVGWTRVQLEGGRRTARFSSPGVSLDLDAIGRGYALDRAADLLRSQRIHRARLTLGSAVLAVSDASPWQAAVADPAAPQSRVALVPLANGAICTFSQSWGGFDRGGVHYGPVIDPRSGQPAPTLGSVSVVARGALRASALCTALLVMGRERAEAYAAEHPQLGVLWLEPSEGVTRGWAWTLPGLVVDPDARIDWRTRR